MITIGGESEAIEGTYLEISVHDSERVQCFNAQRHLYNNLHNDILLEHLIVLSHFLYSLGQVTAVCVLHHQAT